MSRLTQKHAFENGKIRHMEQEEYVFTSEKLFWQPLSKGYDHGSNPSQQCILHRFTSSLQANQHSSMYVGLFHTGYDDLWCKIIWILNIDCATVGHFRLTTLPPCWDRQQSTWNAQLTECHFRTICTRRGIFPNTMILRSLTQILSCCASAAVKDFSGMLCETD